MVTEFRTKRGRCLIEDGELKLEGSVIGYLKNLRRGNIVLFVGVLLTLVFGVGSLFWILIERDFLTLSVSAGILVLILASRIYSIYVRGFTSDEKIPIQKIEAIAGNEGRKALTRPRFIVKYVKNGETKKRYIMMPSKFLSYGEDEYEKAKQVFESQGIEFEER